MKITVFQFELVHTVIFWVMSLCVLYSLFSGIDGRITAWTWISTGVIVTEGIVLAASGWVCPLTLLAERGGATRGSVSDIYLPKWFADRIFLICGTTYGIALGLILFRVFR